VRGTTAVLALAALVGVAGCDDEIGPWPWDSTPVTVSVYSLAREELHGLPAAVDFREVQAIRVDLPGASGTWDVALSEVDGEVVLLPAGAISGIGLRPGIAVIEDQPFEDVVRAPRDTAAYAWTEPVPVRTDVVYVVRADRRLTFGCVYYGKAEVVTADRDAGRVDLRIVQNPICNDRFLVPPDER